MDTVFSPARFGRLMRKYVIGNRSSLRISAIFVAVAMLLIAMINGMAAIGSTAPTNYLDDEIGFMLVVFVFTGCVVASTAFGRTLDKKVVTALLMTPASAFEQCLVRWIFICPLYTLWALVCAMVADALKFVTFKIVLGQSAAMIPWPAVLGIGMPEQLVNDYMILIIFAVTQSFFFLGSVVWRKHSYIKTFLVTGALFMLYAVPSAIVADCYVNSRSVDVSMMGDMMFAPFQILVWLALIINYTLTVMRLKESEIIHRW